MTYSPLEKRTLAKGFGVMMGEMIFGLNGPWSFHGFGLNIPEAAAVGWLVGAAVGYECVDAWLRMRRRRRDRSSVPDRLGAVQHHGA